MTVSLVKETPEPEEKPEPEKREWRNGDFVVRYADASGSDGSLLLAHYGRISHDMWNGRFSVHYLSGIQVAGVSTQAEAEERGWQFLAERGSDAAVPLTFARLGSYVETANNVASTAERERNDYARNSVQLEEFKKRVRAAAMELAREHDWCDVVQRALNGLGISTTRRVTVRFSGDITFTPEDGDGVDSESVAYALASADASDIEITSYRITDESWDDDE